MDDISKLSKTELSKQLKLHNLPSGPITKTTRPLFERKLHKHLAGLGGCETSVSKDDDIKDQNPVSVGDGNANSDTIKLSVVDTHVEIVKEEISSTETPEQFYSIQLPKDTQGVGIVLTDRHVALQQLKKLPGSRLKMFTSREDAIRFSECSEPSCVTASPKLTGNPEVKAAAPMVPNKLKRAIETGDIDAVRSLIWSNPRYLIGSGDTPVIIQMGFHYNALHVAAMKNQPAICELILEALEDVHYVKMLYPDESSATDQQCIDFLLDLYLNTPDKGNCETPLHFACKFGHTNVVDVLASHPRTDKSVVNRDGNTPKDVICERVPHASNEVRQKITQSLEDHYFVPLLRAEDNSKPPQIGAPWTPGDLRHKSVAPSSPMESPITVKAYAGPMGSTKAKEFQKWWRYRKSAGRSVTDCRQFLEIKRSDYEKGLERIGRMIAHDMEISWNEYWDFLDCFADLSTSDGLQKLEDYLQQLHESENELALRDDALLKVEQQMDHLSLGHSPEGTISRGPPDPRRALRCWGTPPGASVCREGEEGEGRDVKVNRTFSESGLHGENDIGEAEGESNVSDGGGDIRSESAVLADGEVQSESIKDETKDNGVNEHKKENVPLDTERCANSETTVSVKDENERVVLVGDGGHINNESRNGERSTLSPSSDGVTVQCETQKDKIQAGAHDKDDSPVSPTMSSTTDETTSCSTSDPGSAHLSTQGGVDTTPQAKTRDELAVTESKLSSHVTTFQIHDPAANLCPELSADLDRQSGSTRSDQIATVVINDDMTCIGQATGEKTNSTQKTPAAIKDISDDKHHKVLKDDPVLQDVSLACSTGITGQTFAEGSRDSDHLSQHSCADKTLNDSHNTITEVSWNATRAHGRGDGFESGRSCDSDGVKVGTNIQPCQTEFDDATQLKDAPPSSVSNVTFEEKIGANVAVTVTNVGDKTEDVLPGDHGTEQSNNNTTKPPKEFTSGSDDACSVCSSVSSYHTARDNVDVDYASLDDVFILSHSQSPSRLPPVFILGNTPSKKDLDVLRALENASVSPDDHPHVTQWRHLVLSYSEEARKTWSTPACHRRLLGNHVTPTLDTTPLNFNSPLYADHLTSGSSVSSQSDEDDFSQHRDMRNVRTNLLSSFTSSSTRT